MLTDGGGKVIRWRRLVASAEIDSLWARYLVSLLVEVSNVVDIKAEAVLRSSTSLV